MANCPECGAKDFYVGFTEQDCSNPLCKHYNPKRIEVKAEEKEYSNDELDIDMSCDDVGCDSACSGNCGSTSSSAATTPPPDAQTTSVPSSSMPSWYAGYNPNRSSSDDDDSKKDDKTPLP